MAASMIFVKGESAQQPLGEFVARVRVALGLTDVTERESSNYADGSYFLGALDDARVKLYYLDTVGLEDYLFAVHVEPSDDRRVAGLARSISRVGFSCFVPAGPWHLLSWDGVGTAYEP